MNDMTNSWSMVDFIVPAIESEIVSDVLWSLGVVAIEERDISEQFITLRTSMGEDPTEAANSVIASFPHVACEFVQVPRAVADTWRQHATATQVNGDVSLVPAWLPHEGEGECLFIEPFDTFGLGNHPTTVLALRLALACTAPHSTVFDLGCGSGVLAVGLAKFQQCTVLAFDIADSAKHAVEVNSERNGVHTVSWHQGIKGTQSDVVLANILAPVLIAESDSIVNGTHVGGAIILSGMRDEQVLKVLSYYDTCIEEKRDSLDGWTAVVLRRTA